MQSLDSETWVHARSGETWVHAKWTCMLFGGWEEGGDLPVISNLTDISWSSWKGLSVIQWTDKGQTRERFNERGPGRFNWHGPGLLPPLLWYVRRGQQRVAYSVLTPGRLFSPHSTGSFSPHSRSPIQFSLCARAMEVLLCLGWLE